MSNKTATTANTKVNKQICRCRDCQYAHLVMYGNNPVIAECLKKPNVVSTRFPYAVDVASTLKRCELYKLRTATEEIEHRPLRNTSYIKGFAA